MEEKKKKVVVAFSGGLDTSFTVMYLAKEKGYEVYAAVLELARILKDTEIPYNIKFILFSGEEKYMLGSKIGRAHV